MLVTGKSFIIDVRNTDEISTYILNCFQDNIFEVRMGRMFIYKSKVSERGFLNTINVRQSIAICKMLHRQALNSNRHATRKHKGTKFQNATGNCSIYKTKNNGLKLQNYKFNSRQRTTRNSIKWDN